MKKFLLSFLLAVGVMFGAGAAVDYPHIYNVVLTNANTEYSLELPAYTTNITIQCRTAYAVRIAETAGKVAGSTNPFFTLKSGMGYFDLNLKTSKTLYFASAQAGVVVEVFVWGLD